MIATSAGDSGAEPALAARSHSASWTVLQCRGLIRYHLRIFRTQDLPESPYRMKAVRLDGAFGAAQDRGRLLHGQLLAIAQDEGRALHLGEQIGRASWR